MGNNCQKRINFMFLILPVSLAIGWRLLTINYQEPMEATWPTKTWPQICESWAGYILTCLSTCQISMSIVHTLMYTLYTGQAPVSVVHILMVSKLRHVKFQCQLYTVWWFLNLDMVKFHCQSYKLWCTYSKQVKFQCQSYTLMVSKLRHGQLYGDGTSAPGLKV